MTLETLKSKSRKDLAKMARDQNIAGWHDMTKAELVRSLVRKGSATNNEARRRAGDVDRGENNTRAALRDNQRSDWLNKSKKELMLAARELGLVGLHSCGKEELAEIVIKATEEKSQRRLTRTSSTASGAPNGNLVGASLPASTPAAPSTHREPLRRANDLSNAVHSQDRIVTMVRDSFWLHVYWEISIASVQRAAAALGQEWYGAKPILRLMDIANVDTSAAGESIARDIEIHGGVNNWYIDVNRPPRSFRVDIGYLGARGRFFCLGRSNVVTTPKPGMADMADEHWKSVKENYERVFALSGGVGADGEASTLKTIFEERLKRPMSTGLGEYGSGAMALANTGFHFEVDAELIVYGATDPRAHVTLQGEPIALRKDGTFTLRFSLPDGRQILPIVAQTQEGLEERTIVLAIERNTKELEPMIHDGQEP